eukprot:355906-Amphidinium_carterae.1
MVLETVCTAHLTKGSTHRKHTLFRFKSLESQHCHIAIASSKSLSRGCKSFAEPEAGIAQNVGATVLLPLGQAVTNTSSVTAP